MLLLVHWLLRLATETSEAIRRCKTRESLVRVHLLLLTLLLLLLLSRLLLLLLLSLLLLLLSSLLGLHLSNSSIDGASAGRVLSVRGSGECPWIHHVRWIAVVAIVRVGWHGISCRETRKCARRRVLKRVDTVSEYSCRIRK